MDRGPNLAPINVEGEFEPVAKYLAARIHLQIFSKIPYLAIMQTFFKNTVGLYSGALHAL